jgi:hypothetical protein
MLAANVLLFDDTVIHAGEGSKLLSLGVSEKFTKKVKISDEQARGLILGILYLKEKRKELPNGN